jgi:hypothetical protein
LERVAARKAPLGILARKERAEALNRLSPSINVYDQNAFRFNIIGQKL